MTVFDPLAIVRVSVPLNVPLPDARERVTSELPLTLLGTPPESCDWTVTLNGTPACPLDGTKVKASFVAFDGAATVMMTLPLLIVRTATVPAGMPPPPLNNGV